jgi:hypothetical protein
MWLSIRPSVADVKGWDPVGIRDNEALGDGETIPGSTPFPVGKAGEARYGDLIR